MFLDIAIGLLCALVYAMVANVDFSIGLLLFGVCFALLPDFDFIAVLFSKKMRGRFAHRHRNVLHHPLLLLPAVFFTVQYLLSTSLATLAVFATLLHFIHDSFGEGWGVKWLSPFSNKMFKCFENKQIICSRSPSEVDLLADKHGNDDWIRDGYLRLNKTLVFQFMLLIVLLIFAVIVGG
jgi:hypothetical protein